MISIRISVRPEIWANIRLLEGRAYRVLLSRRPMGAVSYGEWRSYMLGLLRGSLTYRDVPHVEIGGFDGSVLRWVADNVPRGRVVSYGYLATVFSVHPRVIGMVMRRNRLPLVYPCHRVVRSDGRLGGYVDVGMKAELLSIEGVVIVDGRVLKHFFIRQPSAPPSPPA